MVWVVWLDVADEHALGHFQHQILRQHPVRGHHAQQFAGEARVVECFGATLTESGSPSPLLQLFD